jgi:hypothetical protein
VITSLNHPRKIILVELQIGKAKGLSTPLRTKKKKKMTFKLKRRTD